MNTLVFMQGSSTSTELPCPPSDFAQSVAMAMRSHTLIAVEPVYGAPMYINPFQVTKVKGCE